MTEAEFRRFVDAAKALEACPLYIDDTPALPICQVAARARRRRWQVVELVPQFDDDSLRGFLADAGQAREGRTVAVRDVARQLTARGARENVQRQLGADAADAQQPPEQGAFRGGGKSIQRLVVLGGLQVGAQHQGLAGRRQLREQAGGHLDLVTDAVDVDDQQWGVFRDQGSRQSRYHRWRACIRFKLCCVCW